jgi:hypothetical protein
MKELVTKFDLESAFKALDEIEIPVAEKGIRANKPALTEIFSRKPKFDSLFEEYYDISTMDGLDDAKEAREAEVAQAKLERIEKIVDLDADSAEDLLTSYVGKYIMQCPQCMTLFYKDKEDIVESEDDPSTVNASEVCQHCGNDSGYTLVGKVDDATPEAPEEPEAEEPTIEEEPIEENPEEGTEEPTTNEADLDINLDAINLDEPEEEKTEEAFTAHTGEPLVEEIQDDKDITDKLDANREYIDYLMTVKAQEEEALEKADNEQIKAAIQRRIDALSADIEGALPDSVKNELAAEEAPIEDIPAEEAPIEEAPIEEIPSGDVTEDGAEENTAEEVTESLTEALHEDKSLDISEDEFEELINSSEFKRPISDSAVRAMLNSEKEDEEVEESLEEGIFDKVKDKLAGAKDKVVKFIDTQLKSRASSADWVLKNALVSYDNVTISNDGNTETKDENRKYTTYVVIGYTDKYRKSGKKITTAPKAGSTDLTPGMKYPEAKQKYTDAENIAKGWSKIDGNGPAVIYLAKNESGDGAAFLCQYFKGALDTASDQLEKYVETVRNSLAGSKALAKGGADQSDVRKLKASEIKPGMEVRLEDGTIIEITEVNKSRFGSNKLNLVAKFEDGATEALPVSVDDMLAVMRSSIKNEGLEAIMAGVEELNESSLEKLISDSLVETYQNVAGYRLSECEYLNEKLNINGTIYFTSGNTRKTTYSFSEAYTEENKIKLIGLNEKLGLDKKFTLTGKIDNTNKTLITESFSNK